jgi:hypothetical protein
MPVRPGYCRNDAAYCRYGHCGSEEATTAAHRRMVVRGRLLWSGQALLIFVVAWNSVEVLGSCVVVDR